MTDSLKAWHPRIGEEVVVTSSKEWAADWVDAAGQPMHLWVAGIRAMHCGALDITVSEEWPLKPQGAFSSSSLTDGFIIGHDGGPDDLAPLTRTPDPRIIELSEALASSEGLESGPNGRGGMRVVAHFAKPGDEQKLFHILNEAALNPKTTEGERS